MPDNLIDAIKVSFEKQTLLSEETVEQWLRFIPVHLFITYHKSRNHIKLDTLNAAQREMFKR